MINLEKKESLTKAVSFGEEDFSKIKWQNLKENKRIFIPYSELPERSVERCAFLDSLISFIEKETGKHCSYISVNETEPYEVNGFYVQLAPELVDRNGNYIKCDDIVYDRDGYEWHVNYYFQDNQLCILIDSGDEYQVVTSLSEYSLYPDDDFEEDDEEINADDYDLTDSKCEKNEKINEVILTAVGILLLIGFVILFVFGLKWLIGSANDILENMASENVVSEAADTAADDEVKNAMKNVFSQFKQLCAWLLPRMIPISISFICVGVCVRMVKRIMRW